MKRMMAVVLSMTLVGSGIAAQAQQGAGTATTAKSVRKKTVAKTSGPAISDQLNEMKQSIDAQQQQIKQLTDLVQSRDQKIQQLEQRLDQGQAAAAQAQTKADTAAAQAAEQGQTVTALKNDVSDLKTTATNSALTLQEAQKSMKEAESPLAIHYKGITVTPGGFLAAETVYRNRALASEATNFNSLNFPGAGQNKISEFYGSGRQSRISMLAEGKFSDVKFAGYYEADFLSAAVTSNNNQTNSYALRQRQVWGQAAFKNGVTFTGGQMWTLVTETRKGVDNRTEALPMTIDPNYTVGFSFARQWGLRLAKNFHNRFWLAAALENPQTTFAASGNANNFAFGSVGAGGSLYNNVNANYSFNAMPDVIVKAAFEPGFGHYEIFGILSRFRDRVYPCVDFVSTSSLCTAAGATAITGAYNASKNGGGLGANGRITVAKHVEFGLHALYGNGVGRYSASGLPDATVNADGTLAPLRSYQGLATLEFHYPRIDVYFNGGEDYSGRRYQINPARPTTTVGYGAPTFSDAGCYTETPPSAGSGFGFGSISCSGNTQRTIQGTFGFWIKLRNGPKGRLQFGPQYSYVVRDAWTGTGATAGTLVAPHGIVNMLYTSFRYYLP
ncbi:MAG: hypothetical protein LAO56_03860 [Acidobacteriia bacterium]|nr:hypothetical protein [Terriglobia bacterium]